MEAEVRHRMKALEEVAAADRLDLIRALVAEEEVPRSRLEGEVEELAGRFRSYPREREVQVLMQMEEGEAELEAQSLQRMEFEVSLEVEEEDPNLLEEAVEDPCSLSAEAAGQGVS